MDALRAVRRLAADGLAAAHGGSATEAMFLNIHRLAARQELETLAASAIAVAALSAWKCPSCGGSGVYEKHGRDLSTGRKPHPLNEKVPCRVCGQSGLHPTATAAIDAVRAA